MPRAAKSSEPRSGVNGVPGASLLYHFCRMQIPSLPVPPERFAEHLGRTFRVFEAKVGSSATWESYLGNLYPMDWFLTIACLEGAGDAWELLFASRAGRSDCLLVDALRARAIR